MDHRLKLPDFLFWAGLRVAYRMQYTSHRHGLVTSTNINFTTTINDFIIDHHVPFRRRVAGNSRQPPSWMTTKSILSHARAAQARIESATHPNSNSINSGLAGEKSGPPPSAELCLGAQFTAFLRCLRTLMSENPSNAQCPGNNMTAYLSSWLGTRQGYARHSGTFMMFIYSATISGVFTSPAHKGTISSMYVDRGVAIDSLNSSDLKRGQRCR